MFARLRKFFSSLDKAVTMDEEYAMGEEMLERPHSPTVNVDGTPMTESGFDLHGRGYGASGTDPLSKY